MLSAVQQVLDDKDFKIKSVVVTKAHDIAAKLLKWSIEKENKAILKIFSDELVAKLEEVFVGTVKPTGSIIDRDKLWKRFFILRSSVDYRNKWEDFLQLISGESSSSALFYQRITEIIFRSLIKSHFQISSEGTTIATINDHEKNALRYAAGYVCRHLKSKIENSSHALKEELVLCLMTMVKCKGSTEDIGMAEEWTELLDRGGLWRIKETTFHFFCALEEEIQVQLKLLPEYASARKQMITKSIMAYEDIQFYWLIVTADFEVDEDEVQSTLLSMIVELYLTIRGFSFASNWIGQYKQSAKKAHRNLSLRKNLCSVAT